MRRTLLGAAALAAGFFATGCSSTHIPPFPNDPDPCASYCLVWVPPTTRPVPKVVVEKPGCYVPETVCYDRLKFTEVEKPGMYTVKCVPDECRAYQIVQATPAREEWKRVKCKDPCGCGNPDCFRRVHVPPCYGVCEKQETEIGYEYCAFTPPERSLVTTRERCQEKVRRYVPPQYRIEYCDEIYEPGHYEWQSRYCDAPETCAKTVVAPCTSCTKRQPCFAHCPSQD